MKSDLEGNIDPDYDSDQEYIEGSHDFLLRRLMLNVTEKDS